MARALGVQTREIWQVTTGSLSVNLEPSKTTENPHFSFLALIFAPLLYSHAATARHSLQAFPVDTAMDTINAMRVWTPLMRVRAACACVCKCMQVCACVCWYLEELVFLCSY